MGYAASPVTPYGVVMPARPRCYAVNELVGTVSGNVPAFALGAEVWRDRVVVSLGAVAGDTSDVLLEEYQARYAAWDVKHEGRPPRQPAEALVSDLQIELQDGAGTVFKLEGASAGGTGTEWASTQFFTPAPVGDWLMMSFTDSKGRREIRIELSA